MADIVTQHNIAQTGTLRRLADHSTATAGGSGAATTVTGTTIDRMGFSNGALPLNADMAVLFEATLASGATLSLGYDVQTAPDGSTWTDFQTATYAVAATGPSGGGTIKTAFSIPCDLTMAQRYIRLNYNPSFSSTGTDTFYADAVAFFAGFGRLPSATA